MSKVAVVTDSTANIPEELIQRYSLQIVPLQVIWGDETFRDGVDIQPDEFYTRLKTAKVMPTTSQPSPAVFAAIYQKLLEEGHDIISMHLSDKLSGTMDSARQAVANFPGQRIHLCDTETTAMSMGFQVLTVARAAAQGATLEECRDLSNQVRSKTGVVFAVNTLEFLRRGGRIGGAQAFLGTVLDLKPILELKNARIEPVERVRTMSKAVDRLIDLFQERVGDSRPIRVACLHAQAPNEAKLLLERIRQRYSDSDLIESMIGPVSPVIGTHVGPGTMAIAYMAG